MRRMIYGGLIILSMFLFAAVTDNYLADAQQRSIQPKDANKRGTIMTEIDREELTKRAITLGSPIHTTLEKPETVVERIMTPFFSSGAIYRVSTRPPDRPRTYMLGVWGTENIKVLNNSSDNFYGMVNGSGLKLVSADDYVAYVTTFLDATRDFTGGIQVLNGIEESWWLPKPTPEESDLRNEIIAKYSSVVGSPRLSRDQMATVELFVIRNRSLLLLKAKVSDDGQISFAEEILEPKMPTVMLR